LAILYINYLVNVLDGDQDPKGGFRAELKPVSRKICSEKKHCLKSEIQVRKYIYLTTKFFFNLFFLVCNVVLISIVLSLSLVLYTRR